MGKRFYDVGFAIVALMLTAPLQMVIAALIKLDDSGPVYFRQQRIGKKGRPFQILKFRTMTPTAEHGPSLTRIGDARITRVGGWLRRRKLDELPQLWNVLCGEMSLVGPRPELPQYVERYTYQQRTVLAYKPGITDLASLVFRNEADLFPPNRDPEAFYLSYCLPKKIALSLEHARRNSLWFDTWVILRSVMPLRSSKHSPLLEGMPRIKRRSRWRIHK